MSFKPLALVVIALIAMPAVAQTDNAAQPAAKPKKERKICRTLEPAPGSNMMRSSCKTKDEWAQADGNPTASSNARSASDGGNMGPGVR